MLVLAAILVQAQQSQPGTGDPVAKDARITVHFVARLQDGTTLADTEQRGMAFTFLMGQDTVQPFWHQAVSNLRVGGVRTLKVKASQVGLAIAGDPPIDITVKVIRVAAL